MTAQRSPAPAPEPPGAFDADTAWERTGEGGFVGWFSDRWLGHEGLFGGYVAATAVRGLQAAVADPDLEPASVTVHMLAPPAVGTVALVPTVERVGRSVATATARLVQDDRPVVVATGTLARARDGLAFQTLSMPSAPAPEAAPVWGVEAWGHARVLDRYEGRWVAGGPPFSGSDDVVSAGWVRLREARPVDHALATLFADAWMPPVFPRAPSPVAAPTVELQVSFPARLPLADSAGAWVLVRFEADYAAGGFYQELGSVWSREGALLARSRQLAAVRPPRSADRP